jgi:hypothetical protein
MATNGTTNGSSSQVLSTLPAPDHNWQVTLSGKVIASKSNLQTLH